MNILYMEIKADLGKKCFFNKFFLSKKSDYGDIILFDLFFSDFDWFCYQILCNLKSNISDNYWNTVLLLKIEDG